MPDRTGNNSDDNWPPAEADILKLSDFFDISREHVTEMLENARRLFLQARSQPDAANKRAIVGLRPMLDRIIAKVEYHAVRERLIAGVCTCTDALDEEIERYREWWMARERVAQAIAGAHDLRDLLLEAERLQKPAGRPIYENWEPPIRSLLDSWSHGLGRNVTVSGHAQDARGPKPSPALALVYQAMRLIDPHISEQACRTVIRNIQNDKSSWLPSEAL